MRSKLIISSNIKPPPPHPPQWTTVSGCPLSCTYEIGTSLSVIPASLFCQNRISHLHNISVEFFLKPHYFVNIFPVRMPLLIATCYPENGLVIDGFWNVGLADTADAATDSTQEHHVNMALLLKNHGVLPPPPSTCECWNQPQSLSDLSPPFVSDPECPFVSGREEQLLWKLQRRVKSKPNEGCIS